MTADGENCKADTERFEAQIRALNQRIRELNCLYGISWSGATGSHRFETVLQKAVNLIPTVWRYPEICGVSITIGDQTYESEGFKGSAWKQTAAIGDRHFPCGILTVCFAQESPDVDEELTLAEVRQLLNAIAELIGAIMAQKQEEERYRCSQEQLTLLTDSAPVLTSYIDSDQRIVFANALFEQWYGMARNRIIGRTLQNFLSPENYASIKPHVESALSGACVSYETRFCYPDGRVRDIDGKYAPHLSEQGHVLGFFSLVQDITHRKQTEFNLKAAMEAAQAAALTKTQFLANMSHEIRTPLNAVIGMTEVLLNTHLAPEQREYARIVMFSADQLLSLVNDILDFSKIEAGKLSLETVDFNFRRIIETSCEALKFKAYQKGVALTYSSDPQIPVLLKGDPGRLLQIINNLGSNAIKFTHQGSIAIVSRRLAQEAGSIRLHFKISDTGIGIPADRLTELFSPFTQVDASTTRKYGGTGLGLAISQMLVKLMNGEIGVDSELGKGASFWFTAEFKPASPPLNQLSCPGETATPNNAAAFSAGNTGEKVGRRQDSVILIVEDNLFNSKLAQLLLEKLGYASVIVNNGTEALEVLSQNSHFALILMDCQMPEMDGYQAAKLIRHGSACAHYQNIPIIAMTAHAMDGDRDQCLNAGMNDYLSKPFREQELKQLLEKWLPPPG